MSATSGSIEVRAATGAAERQSAFRLMTETFSGATDLERATRTWQQYVEEFPGQPPGRVRAAFRDGTCVGAYLVDDRVLQVAGASVAAGFVGAVVVDAPWRQRGIGTAMMQDSFAYARERRLGLLLLHGAPRFYAPFGYVDIFDPTFHRVNTADVAGLPEPGMRVRALRPADGPNILRLAERSFAGYSGWCVRSEAQQAHLLRFACMTPEDRGDGPGRLRPQVAVTADDEIRGYLLPSWGTLGAFGCEVTGDDWDAVAGLARYQASQRAADRIGWPLPNRSLTASLLADHLPVEVRQYHEPLAGWMAAVADGEVVLDALVRAWEPGLSQRVDLRIGSGQRQLGTGRSVEVVLSPAAALPLLFGYRSVSWARTQPGCEIPEDLAVPAALGAARPWIVPSHGF